jgi:hypothetical protein
VETILQRKWEHRNNNEQVHHAEVVIMNKKIQFKFIKQQFTLQSCVISRLVTFAAKI